MNHLLRSHAPITEAGWQQLDHEIQQRLVPALAARRLVDFSGPHGWEHSATNLGRVAAIAAPAKGLAAYQRRVLPLAELRADFTVSRDELRDVDRGAVDLDLARARRGRPPHRRGRERRRLPRLGRRRHRRHRRGRRPDPIALGERRRALPPSRRQGGRDPAQRGISGPYGLALGPDGYTGVVETTEHGGLIVFDHLRQILGGPIVWAPGVIGAVVLSLRGGDFLFEVGQDLSVGYDHHDADNVHLYLEESFTFRAVTPEAAVVLTP